jgi:hypothetical protein
MIGMMLARCVPALPSIYGSTDVLGLPLVFGFSIDDVGTPVQAVYDTGDGSIPLAVGFSIDDVGTSLQGVYDPAMTTNIALSFGPGEAWTIVYDDGTGIIPLPFAGDASIQFSYDTGTGSIPLSLAAIGNQAAYDTGTGSIPLSFSG